VLLLLYSGFITKLFFRERNQPELQARKTLSDFEPPQISNDEEREVTSNLNQSLMDANDSLEIEPAQTIRKEVRHGKASLEGDTSMAQRPDETINNNSFDSTESEHAYETHKAPEHISGFEKIALKTHYKLNTTWKNKGCLTRCLYILEIFPHFITALIIPPVDSPLFFQAQSLMYPFTIPLFFMTVKGYLSSEVHLLGIQLPIIFIVLLISAVVSTCLYLFAEKSWKPKPRKLFLMLTIVACLIILDCVLNLTLDVLAAFKLLLGVSEIFLGMSILGIGNSIVDLFVNRNLAKQGYHTLAVSGLFSGQMFNFLVGFGLSTLFLQFKGDGKFNLFTSTQYKPKQIMMILFMVGMNILSLVFILGYLWFGRMKATKTLAGILFVVYAFLVCGLALMEFKL
jgi:Ca2+/Na+ antiporter